MVDGEGEHRVGAAFDASRVERDRTLEAMRDLEWSLASAAGGGQWRNEVVAKLEALEMAMTVERRELHRPDALLAMVGAEHPRRFGSHIRNLREQYDDIIRQVRALLSELDGSGDEHHDPGDVRQRAGWIIRALHHCRARQTDLVYDALELDLGSN